MTILDIKTPRVFLPLLEPARYKGAFGGRGCVHSDTIIDTPTGPVKIQNFKGGQVYTLKDGVISVGLATAPKKYWPVQLHEVCLSTGQKIICTDQHKFLTCRGWVELRDLSMNDVFVVAPFAEQPSLLLTSLGIFLSALRADVRHCFRKLASLTGGYWLYLRQYGQLLRLAKDIFQAFSPLPAGVLQHNYRALFRSDDRGCASNDILSLSSRLPSNRDAAPVGEEECCEGAGNYNVGKSSELLLGFSRQLLRSLLKTCRILPDRELSTRRQVHGSCQGQSGTAQRLVRTLGDIALCNRPYHNSHAVETSPTIAKLAYIRNHSRQCFWDIHVYETHNYLSNGIVNHNSGKSHFFAELLVERCMLVKGTRAVCIREVQKSLKESAKRLIEDKISSLGVSGHFEVLNDSIKTPGGGIIIFQGMQDHTAESIKSLEGFHVAWCEEAQTLTARSLEMLRPTMRAGSELWFSWNPRRASDPVDRLLRGDEIPERSIVVKANYSDNPFLPEELEEERSFDKRHAPDRYQHIWLGEYEPMAVGAIWSRQTIEDTRIHEAPELTRIVVGVDPAVTDTETSDMHGIVVDALGVDGHGYCLADMSMKGQPREWAVAAVAAYDMFEADAIVIEVNQGGDMVKHTLNSVRPGLRIIEVRATRGKHVRAEPISALYSLGRFHHVGTHLELENQMCLTTAEGYAGEGSPDRLDAHVWAATELFPRITRRPATQEKQFWTPPVQGGWMGS